MSAPAASKSKKRQSDTNDAGQALPKRAVRADAVVVAVALKSSENQVICFAIAAITSTLPVEAA
jgi:hypothetical protein